MTLLGLSAFTALLYRFIKPIKRTMPIAAAIQCEQQGIAIKPSNIAKGVGWAALLALIALMLFIVAALFKHYVLLPLNLLDSL